MWRGVSTTHSGRSFHPPVWSRERAAVTDHPAMPRSHPWHCFAARSGTYIWCPVSATRAWKITITCIVSNVVTMFWISVMANNEIAHAYKLREKSCKFVRVDLKHINCHSHLRARRGDDDLSHYACCWRRDRRHQDRIQESNIDAHTRTATEKQYGDDEESRVMV